MGCFRCLLIGCDCDYIFSCISKVYNYYFGMLFGVFGVSDLGVLVHVELFCDLLLLLFRLVWDFG